jgi:hypothetical protein
VAGKKCRRPKRQRVVLDEKHGFEHVEPLTNEQLQRLAGDESGCRARKADEK